MRQLYFAVLIAALCGTASAATTLIANYSCNANASTSCMARDFTLVSAASDYSTWEAVYNQFSINDTSNTTQVVYANSTGFRKPIAADMYSELPGRPAATDPYKRIGAFRDGDKIYVAYARLYQGNPAGTAEFLKVISYDRASQATATLNTLSSTFSGFQGFVSGVAASDKNTTHFYVSLGTFNGKSGEPLTGYRLIALMYEKGTGTQANQFYLSTPNDENHVTGQVSNGTNLLVHLSNTTGSTQGARYWAFSNEVWHTPNASHAVSWSGAGETYGMFPHNNASGVLTTSRDGNRELYAAFNNGTIVRLTTTSGGETATSSLNSSDGTSLFTYFNDSYAVLGESFCRPSLALGSQCAAGGTNCLTGYYYNGTQCVAGSGAIGTFPNVELIVSDAACLGDIARINTGLGNDCGFNGFLEPFRVQDWLYASYKINGLYALPPGKNISSYPGQPVIEANATCLFNLTTSPSTSKPPAFAVTNGSARYNGVPLWGAEVRETAPNFEGSQVTVLCNSSIADTDAKAYFIVANTVHNITGYTLTYQAAGSVTPDIIPANASSWNTRWVITTDGSGPYADRIIGSEIEIPQISYSDEGGIFRYWSCDGTGNNCQATLTSGDKYIGLPIGNIRIRQRVLGTSVSYYTNLTVGRSPSIEVSKNVQVSDACAVTGYANTTLLVTARDYTGNRTVLFEAGEDVYVTAPYSYAGTPISGANCTLAIWNLTSNSILTQGYNMPYSDGAYRAKIVSDRFSDISAPNGGYYDLSPGNYSANVTCTNRDTRQCLLPRSSSVAFRTNYSDGCPGTSYACTLGTCQPCPTVPVTCENGQSFNITQDCASRRCVQPNEADVPACRENQRYAITAEFTPGEVPCGNDQVELRIKLLRDGVMVPPADEIPMSCSLDLFPAGGTGGSATYEVPVTSGAYIKFPLSGKIDGIRLSQCGNQVIGAISCFSGNFSGGVKAAEARFFIGSIASNCFFTGEVVRDAECVYSVTATDSTKGLMCASGTIVNNSRTCGCPIGTTVNATTNGCDGRREVSEWFYTAIGLGWLSLPVLLAILLLGPLVLRVWSIKRQNRPTVNLPPEMFTGRRKP